VFIVTFLSAIQTLFSGDFYFPFLIFLNAFWDNSASNLIRGMDSFSPDHMKSSANCSVLLDALFTVWL